MWTAKTDQTGQMPRLIWVFAGRTCHFWGFVMLRLNYWVGPEMWLFVWSLLLLPVLGELTMKVLARLHGCAGLPKPSLFAYVISTVEPPHDKNQQNSMCPQRRLRSAWESHGSWGPNVSSGGQRRLSSDWADLSLRWAQSFCWFCHEEAHLHMGWLK